MRSDFWSSTKSVWHFKKKPSARVVLNGTIFFCTVEPPCATTSRKWPSIQNTKTFPVKALQLEPLVNYHLL